MIRRPNMSTSVHLVVHLDLTSWCSVLLVEHLLVPSTY